MVKEVAVQFNFLRQTVGTTYLKQKIQVIIPGGHPK